MNKNHNVTNRIIAVFLAAVMLLSMVPSIAMAATKEYPNDVTISVSDGTNLIEGVTASYTVKTTAPSEDICSSTSDENGVCVLPEVTAAISAGTLSEDVTVTLSKDGYISKTVTIATTEVYNAGFNETLALAPVAVTVSKTGSGTIEINGNDSLTELASGSNANISIMPANGYEISSVVIDSVAKTVADKDAYSETISNVTGSLNVTVVFVTRKYVVTIGTADGGAILRADGADIIDSKIATEKDSTIEFVFEADSGYKVDEALLDDTSITLTGDNKYTLTVIDDCALSASFNDIEAPAISRISVANAATWKSEKAISYTVSDNSGTVKEVYISSVEYATLAELNAAASAGEAFSASKTSYTLLADGTYYIYAVDDAGNLGKNSVLVEKIDTTPPSITEPSVEEKGGKNKTYTYTFDVSDGDSGIMEVYYSATNGADSGTILTAVGGKYSFTVNSSNSHYIYAMDNAGNKMVMDTTGAVCPVFASVVAQDTWSASTNTVQFTVSSDNTIVELFYSKEADYSTTKVPITTQNSGVYSFSVSENGTYYIFAKDSEDNIGCTEVEVDHIDTTKPTVDSISKDPSAEWHNGSIVISGAVSDDQTTGDTSGSGVASVVYSTDENADSLQLTTKAALSNGTYRISVPNNEFNGTYYVWAIDSVDRVSECDSISIKIDKTAPANISLTYDESGESKGFIKEVLNVLTFGLFFKNEVNITIEATDDRTNADSDIAYYEYQLVEMGGTLAENAWVKINSQSTSAEARIVLDEFAGKIYARVWDVAGNCTTAFTDTAEGTVIVLDNKDGEKPTSVAKTDAAAYAGVWTKEDVVIKLSGGETLSGVDYYQYRVVYADSTKAPLDWQTMPESDELIDREGGGKVSNMITIDEDENATYYFRAISNTKVSSKESDGVTVKVQKTTPENATVAIDAPNGTNDWYVTEYPEIIVTEPTVSDYVALVATYYSIWNTTLGQSEPQNGTKFTGANYPEILADGVYTLKIWTVDDAANYCDSQKVIVKDIKVDITAPTDLKIDVAGTSIIAPVSNSVSFDTFYDAAIKIVLSANCDISGLKSLKYQKVKAVADYRETGTWADYNSSTGIPVSPSEKFVLYFRAEDMTGNVTIIHSTGVIVDNKEPVGEVQAPEIDIFPAAANANGYYNGDVSVAIKAVDPKYTGASLDNTFGVYSGLEKITYRILVDDTVTKTETILFPSSDYAYTTDVDGLVQRWNGTIVIDSASNNSNNVVVEVIAVDNAGNSRTTRTAVGEIKIDITAPTIDISYNNNAPDSSKYYKNDRVATIVVTERNFNADDVNVTITNTDGVIPTISAWTEVKGSGNLDNTTYTATITYHADGDYTFAIAYTDLADNQCAGAVYATGTTTPIEFTIDQTAPVIAVSYDNNSAENGKYFKAIRTATITVTEHNFDVGRVQFTQSANAPTPSWTHSGDVHTSTIAYTADGDYTFDVAMTDMAGNQSAAANYGNTVAGQDFTVDTKIVKPVITGVENNKAYPDSVIPAISFDDVNYNDYNATLMFVGTDGTSVDVTTKFIKGVNEVATGFTGAFDTFEKIEANDGIYTLTVNVFDKAGNTESESVTFSVNLFGSSYVMSTSTVALNGSFVKEPIDVVITEINANKLSNIKITLFKNNETITLKEGDDYKVDVKSGNGEWYEYTYTIFAKNFADDGVYRITLHSEDEAGNIAENTLDTKNVEVSFGVDDTNPTLVVTNLESSKTYALENLTVLLSANDNLKLSSLVIHFDGKEYKNWSGDELESLLADKNGEFTFDIIGDSTDAHNIRIVCTDAAGNETVEEITNFFVTTNLWVRYYNNKVLFFGSIGGVLLLTAGLVAFIVLKKKRKTEEA